MSSQRPLVHATAMNVPMPMWRRCHVGFSQCPHSAIVGPPSHGRRSSTIGRNDLHGNPAVPSHRHHTDKTVQWNIAHEELLASIRQAGIGSMCGVPVHSEIRVEAEPRHDHRAAVAVVTGMADVLEIRRYEDPAPHMERVVGFENLLRVVVEPAIAEEEPMATESEVFAVSAG